MKVSSFVANINFSVCFLVCCILITSLCHAAQHQLPLPPLRVKGNTLVNQWTQQPVTVHGVTGPGALWYCLGGYGIFDNTPSVEMVRSMKTWGINVVRTSLNEDCWLDINDMPNAQYAGEAYASAIESYVRMLIDNGMYAILELHWTAPGTQQSRAQMPMPDADHAPAFWTSVARRFAKYSGHVIFDLFNEPYPGDNTHDSASAWACWRDGGSSCPTLEKSYRAVGMQGLVSAVRSTGATNILMLGGINYSNSLTRWLEYKPDDSPLNQLVASWHCYASNYCNNYTCWSTEILPVAQLVPVVAGEIGELDCQATFIDQIMPWLNSKNISFLAWVFDTYSDCKSGPSLVTNITTGACTENYGCGYKKYLQEHYLN